MQNPSYENEFHLHVNENSFSHERPCTKTHFEKEVQENSEMAYSAKKLQILYFDLSARKYGSPKA